MTDYKRTTHLPRRRPLTTAIAAIFVATVGTSSLANEPGDSVEDQSKHTYQSTQSAGRIEQESDRLEGESSRMAQRQAQAQSAADTDKDSARENMQSASASEGKSTSEKEAREALDELISEQGSLKTFVKALEVTGMADALMDNTKYTLFAPTNEAFDQLDRSVEEMLAPENREQLIRLLRAHIVADDVARKMADRLPEARTIDGGSVRLKSEGDKLQIGSASLVGDSIQKGSIRIYPIDAVLEISASGSVADASKQDRRGVGSVESASKRSDNERQASVTTATTPQSSASTDVAVASATDSVGNNGASQSSPQRGQSQGGQPYGAAQPSVALSASAQFTELDRDNNGYLSREELPPEHNTQALDDNNDGRISRTEFAAFAVKNEETKDLRSSKHGEGPRSESAWPSDTSEPEPSDQ